MPRLSEQPAACTRIAAWSPAATVLCLCVVACGHAGRVATSAPRSGAPSGSTAASSPSAAVPPSPSITGDYDEDDNYGEGQLSDADDDNGKPTDRDGDSDNSSGSYYDRDDDAARRFDHAARGAEKRTIARLARRYYAAAAAGDGAAVCSVVVRSLARAVPEDFGRPSAPPYSRGTTCPQVLSKLLAHYHRQLAAHASVLAISDVRVQHGEGIVVLAFRGLPGRRLNIVRERGAWKLEELLDSELP
jgi:hypothetical protein